MNRKTRIVISAGSLLVLLLLVLAASSSVVRAGVWINPHDASATNDDQAAKPADHSQATNATGEGQGISATGNNQGTNTTDSSQAANTINNSQATGTINDNQGTNTTDSSQAVNTANNSQATDTTNNSQAANTTNNSQGVNTTDNSQFMSVANDNQENEANTVTAHLRHTPYGMARLQWNEQTKDLLVIIHLRGLQAMTHHPAHIHAGACASDGAIVYSLNDVVANEAGNGSSVTTIKNVMGGIPVTGWYVNVHSGPTLNTPAEALSITCGNVLNPQQVRTVDAPLGSVATDNQSVQGVATLTISQGNLIVRAAFYNLVPGSSHAFHIHSGSCQQQIPGTVLYTLTPVTADERGFASSTTVIKGVSVIPATGWYLNLHFGTDLSTQSGYDPIACGNVR